ncbi:hypothetical protein [Kocuria sabuli]|uniref:hypothetical protein n=1 Tax=Kocuria sabuli TaxID=3071448 RepID=UPI0034D57AC2
MDGLCGAALLEVLSAAATNTGLALVVAAVLIRCLHARWHRTEAIHVFADGAHHLRWHTTRYEIHEEPWPHPPVPAPAAGAEVTVYFHVRDPHRWALTAPYRTTWWLLGVGAVLTGIGLLLPVLLG